MKQGTTLEIMSTVITTCTEKTIFSVTLSLISTQLSYIIGDRAQFVGNLSQWNNGQLHLLKKSK